MAVDALDLDFYHRFNLMRRDASAENEEETQAGFYRSGLWA